MDNIVAINTTIGKILELGMTYYYKKFQYQLASNFVFAI